MAFQLDQQIRNRIDEFVTELDTLVRQAAVASVAQALQGRGAAPSRALSRARPAAARSGARRKGQKRDPRELDQLTERLLASIRKNSGQRIEQIAVTMGTTTKELALPAKKLIADKKVRTTGNRRATRYFPR
jgi:hypothetical protein